MATERTEQPESGTPERIVTLTDAVVAIAMTLLALDLRPDLPADVSSGRLGSWLGDHAGQYAALVVAFAVIAQYWATHHRLMRGVDRHDDSLTWATMLFLFVVTLLPLTSYLQGYYGDSLAISLFAGNLMLGSLSIGLIGEVVDRHGLRTGPHPPEARRRARWRAASSVSVSLLVGVLAWVLPRTAEFFFLLYFAIDLPGALAVRRRRAG